MIWNKAKQESTSKNQKENSLSQNLAYLQDNIFVVLNSLDPQDVKQFLNLIEGSKIKAISLCKAAMQKMLQLIYFRHLIKSLTTSISQQLKKRQQITSNLKLCGKSSEQMFKIFQKKLSSLEQIKFSLKGLKEHKLFYEKSQLRQNQSQDQQIKQFLVQLKVKLDQYKQAQDNIDIIFVDLKEEDQQLSMNQKIQIIGRTLNNFKKIYENIKIIRPLLKEIVMKQSQQQREISMIIDGEQDEGIQFERLYFSIKQLHQSRTGIDEDRKQKQFSYQRRQEIQRLKTETLQARRQIQNYQKQLLGLKATMLRNKLKLNQKINRNLREQSVDDSTVVQIDGQNDDTKLEEKQMVILYVKDQINQLYELIYAGYDRQNSLKEKLQEMNKIEYQLMQECAQRVQQFQMKEIKRIQILINSKYATQQREIEARLQKLSHQMMKKLQENRIKQQQNIRNQLQNKRAELFTYLETEISSKRRQQEQKIQNYRKQQKDRIQHQIQAYHQQRSKQLQQERIKEQKIKKNQQETEFSYQQQTQLKLIKQNIQNQQEKLKRQLKQLRQKELSKVQMEIDNKRKVQLENLSLQTQKYIEQRQKLKLELQERIQNEIKSYRISEDKRIVEQLRCSRQKIDQKQKKQLQQKRILQDQMIRKNLARARKQEDQKLRQQLKVSRQKLNLDYSKFFNHNILRKNYHFKEFLVNTISERYRSDIEYTQLLFTFDPKNKTNFHQYIDNKPNILVVIELQNGYYLAAFTQSPFKPKTKGTDAFIVCLNTSMVYQIKAGEKAISYDDYYLIFGNSEIRLKSGEKMIFSNFGIGNSSFNHKGHNIEHLFGGGRINQVPLQSYEIYQITFE